VGPPRGHKPCHQTCCGVSSSILGATSPAHEACSSTGSPQCHSLLWASACSGVWSLPWAAGRYLLHRGPPWAAGTQPAPPWSAPGASGESLLGHLEHLLPLLLHQPWCLQSCLSHIISLLSLLLFPHSLGFLPFLNMLSQRRYHCR